jgi:hypothetical protein
MFSKNASLSSATSDNRMLSSRRRFYSLLSGLKKQLVNVTRNLPLVVHQRLLQMLEVKLILYTEFTTHSPNT